MKRSSSDPGLARNGAQTLGRSSASVWSEQGSRPATRRAGGAPAETNEHATDLLQANAQASQVCSRLRPWAWWLRLVVSRLSFPAASALLGRALACGVGSSVAMTASWRIPAVGRGPWACRGYADCCVGRCIDLERGSTNSWGRGRRRRSQRLLGVYGAGDLKETSTGPIRPASSLFGVVGEVIVRGVGPASGVGGELRRRRCMVMGGTLILDECSTPSGTVRETRVMVVLLGRVLFHQASAVVPATGLLRLGIGLGGRGDPATVKLRGALFRLGLGGGVGSGLFSGRPGSGSSYCLTPTDPGDSFMTH